MTSSPTALERLKAVLGRMERGFAPQPLLKADLKAAVEAIEALKDTLCELTACASQLASKGMRGRSGDSVSRAQEKARAALSRLTLPTTDGEKK